MKAGPEAVDALLAGLMAGRLPRWRQVGWRVRRSHYDGRHGSRAMVDREAVLELVTEAAP